jgi:hypothetical protein
MDNCEGIGESSFESLYYDNRMDVAFKLWKGLSQNFASYRKSERCF